MGFSIRLNEYRDDVLTPDERVLRGPIEVGSAPDEIKVAFVSVGKASELLLVVGNDDHLAAHVAHDKLFVLPDGMAFMLHSEHERMARESVDSVLDGLESFRKIAVVIVHECDVGLLSQSDAEVSSPGAPILVGTVREFEVTILDAVLLDEFFTFWIDSVGHDEHLIEESDLGSDGIKRCFERRPADRRNYDGQGVVDFAVWSDHWPIPCLIRIAANDSSKGTEAEIPISK